MSEVTVLKDLDVPSIDEVASALKSVQTVCDGEIDVRLQVYPDGQWAVRFGPSDYDTDHLGYWGAASIEATDSRETLRAVADELLDQIQDEYSNANACDVGE